MKNLTTYDMIALLPALYHIGSWGHVKTVQLGDLVMQITGLLAALKLTLVATPEVTQSTVKHPTIDYIRHLFVRAGEPTSWRLDILDKELTSFAIVALVEVLGWWAYKGHTLGETRSADYRGDGSSSVPLTEFVASYILPLQVMVRRTPMLSYILPIATALANDQKPRKPKSSKSLLYGPLIDSNRRCGLDSCRKTPEDAGIQDLLQCRGGCEGLEQYCCDEHQREHWPSHRKFCKLNKREMR